MQREKSPRNTEIGVIRLRGPQGDNTNLRAGIRLAIAWGVLYGGVRPPERIVTASLTHVEVALRRSVRQKWRKAVGLVAADVRGGCPQIRSRRQVVSCEVRPRPAIRAATMTNGALCNSQGVSITVGALDVSDVAYVRDAVLRFSFCLPARRQKVA
jgi:hypothetical protein